MNINYADSCNFKPIPAITPLDGYWQNSTWKFNMSEITAGAASQPSWQDIILSGNTALTLVNSKANGLNYLKLFGGTEQRLLPDTYQLYTSVEANGITYEYSSQNLTQIPCKRIADNVFGLYNYTTKVFISEV